MRRYSGKKNGKGDRYSEPWKMSRFQQIAMSRGLTLMWLRYDRWNVYWKIKLKRDWDEQIDGLEWHAKHEKIISGPFWKLSWNGGQKTNGSPYWGKKEKKERERE